MTDEPKETKTADSAEWYLKSLNFKKNGIQPFKKPDEKILNSYQEPKLESEPIEVQLRERIYQFLTNDLAKTIDIKDPNFAERRIQRFLALTWDGTPGLRTDLVSYQLFLKFQFGNLNLETLQKENPPSPQRGDRIDIEIFDRFSGHHMYFSLLTSNTSGDIPGVSAWSSHGGFKLEGGEATTEGMAAFGVQSDIKKWKTSIGEDIELLNKILRDGSLDVEATHRAQAYMVNKESGEIINNADSLSAISKYTDVSMHSLLSQTKKFIELAESFPNKI